MLQRYTATMLDLLTGLVVSNSTKIVLLSLDGLAGLPHPRTGKSEMETARLPNLDALATEAACGLLRHVAPGITPGSGPGHLGLFGYDPLRYPVGRGVLEALGIEFDLRAGGSPTRHPQTWSCSAASISFRLFRAFRKSSGCEPARSLRIRCTAGSPRWWAWRSSRLARDFPTRWPRSASTGTGTISSSSTTRTPTRREKTGTSTPR